MIIAYSQRDRISFLNFIKNRLARIYPVYLLALILVVLIQYNTINFLDLSLNVLMMQSWFSEKALTLNKPAWSLSVEFFFYIVFPFLINHIYSKVSFKKLSIWIISFWVISQITYHLMVFNYIDLPFYKLKDISYHPIMHINAFLAGNLAGLFFVKNHKKLKGTYRLKILITLFVLIIILKFSLPFNYHNGLLSIVFAPLIILISINSDSLSNLVSHKFFVFLGEISYGIYILQFPIWALLNNYRMRTYLFVNPETAPLLTFTLRLIILIIIASMSYILFEKPMRNRIKKLRFNNWSSNMP